jgi:hypothetical protein
MLFLCAAQLDKIPTKSSFIDDGYTHYGKLPDYAYPGNFLPGLQKKEVIALLRISFRAAFQEISDCQKALFQ